MTRGYREVDEPEHALGEIARVHRVDPRRYLVGAVAIASGAFVGSWIASALAGRPPAVAQAVASAVGALLGWSLLAWVRGRRVIVRARGIEVGGRAIRFADVIGVERRRAALHLRLADGSKVVVAGVRDLADLESVLSRRLPR